MLLALLVLLRRSKTAVQNDPFVIKSSKHALGMEAINRIILLAGHPEVQAVF